MEIPQSRAFVQFTDDADIANYAREAIERFLRGEVINGRGDGSFNPLGIATRAEFAQILRNFLESVEQE